MDIIVTGPKVLKMLKQILETVARIEVKMAALDDALTALTAKVTAEDTEIDSAIVLINGIPKLIADAVSAALAQGATPAQLKSITDLATTIQGKSDALASALVTNTPSAGQTPSA